MDVYLASAAALALALCLGHFLYQGYKNMLKESDRQLKCMDNRITKANVEQKNHISELKDQISMLSVQFKQSLDKSSQNKELKRLIREETLQINELHMIITEKQQQNDDLQQQVGNLKERLAHISEQSTRITRLQVEFDDKQQRIVDQQLQIDSMKGQLSQINEAHINKINELQMQVDIRQLQIDNLQRHYNTLKSKDKAQMEKLDSEETLQINEMEILVAETLQMNDDLQNRIDFMNQQLLQSNEQVQLQTLKVTELQTLVDDKQQQIDNIQGNYNKLRSKDGEHIEKKDKEAQKKIGSSQEHCNNWRLKYKEQFDELRRKYLELQTEIVDLPQSKTKELVQEKHTRQREGRSHSKEENSKERAFSTKVTSEEMEKDNEYVNKAVEERNVDRTKDIIKEGTDVNKADNTGWTPLHWACHNALLLIHRGADVNCKDNDGLTTLQMACSKGDLVAAQVLIEKGADLNVADKRGWTPLHSACSNGRLSVAEVLLRNGADKGIMNLEGEIPIELASLNRKDDFRHLFRRF